MATKTFKIGLSNTDKQNMAQDVYERVLDLTFAEYDSGGTYNEGDFVVYNDLLYRCIADNVTGTWDVSKWEQATLQDLLDDVEGAVASVNDKANVDGNYPTMTVGFAEELTPYGSNSGVEDDTPFVFQTTGGDSDVSSSAKLLELRGKSYALNQLVQNGNFADNTSWSATSGTSSFSTISVASNVLTQTFTSTPDADYKSGIQTAYGHRTDIVNGHYYLIKFGFKSSKSCVIRAYTLGTGYFAYENATANTWLHFGEIKQATSSQTADPLALSISDATILGNGDTLEFSNVMLFDLTLMFGAGNEPTSVLEFNRLFPNAYYEYGNSLVSSKSSAIKNVGYNAFDGELEGNGLSNEGQPIESANNFRTKNYVKVIAGQTYSFYYNRTVLGNTSYQYICEYDADHNFIKKTNGNSRDTETITLSSDTHFIRINYYKSGSGWASNVPSQDTAQICVNLTWDGSRTGYEPYQAYTYDLPNIELRSAGSVYDSITPDGTLVRRVGVVDLGTLTTWSQGVSYGHNEISSTVLRGLTPAVTTGEIPNITCSKYVVRARNLGTEKSISITSGNADISIIDSDLWGKTNAEIQTALSGVLLYYELATPTTTQDDAYKYQENMIVDDFGTQEFIGNGIPQGNQFFYAVDYKAFIDSLGGREDIDYDASEVVSHTELSASEDDRDEVDGQLKDAIGGTLRQLLAYSKSVDFSNTAWVDLGTLTWESTTNNRFMATVSNPTIKYQGDINTVPNVVCTRYKAVSLVDSSSNDFVVSVTSNQQVIIRELALSSMTTDQVKNAMKGVILAYEKA